MEAEPMRAVELVRAIREQVYEETKHLSREELKAYIAHGARATDPRLSGDSTPSSPGRSAA